MDCNIVADYIGGEVLRVMPKNIRDNHDYSGFHCGAINVSEVQPCVEHSYFAGIICFVRDLLLIFV